MVKTYTVQANKGFNDEDCEWTRGKTYAVEEIEGGHRRIKTDGGWLVLTATELAEFGGNFTRVD